MSGLCKYVKISPQSLRRQPSVWATYGEEVEELLVVFGGIDFDFFGVVLTCDQLKDEDQQQDKQMPQRHD